MKKKVVFVALSLALTLSLCACGELLETSNTESSKNSESSQTEASTKGESSEKESEPSDDGSLVSENDTMVSESDTSETTTDGKSSEESEIVASDASFENESTIESSVEPVPHRTGEYFVGVSDKSLENDGVYISFLSFVNNDVTGNWRLAKTSSNINIADYALDYYKTYFKDDEEIHAVVNFSNRTTTKVSVSKTFGVIGLTVHEYVDKEEHDAKELFGGKVLESYNVYLDNGDIERTS